IPFSDGSSIAFNGETFNIQRTPVNDEKIININICEAELVWADNKKRLKIMQALQDAWTKQRELQRDKEIKQVYNNKF
ncbi:MAG: hypothetical protein IJ576_09365, partial [Synergistaceae bacterium]|nr:hypothetical protein [Synergistaceae bacterium]